MGVYKFIFSKQLLKNIGIAIGVVILLCVLVLQLLKIYTRHGQAVEVPDLNGILLQDALPILQSRDLGYQIIDSVYMGNKIPGTIIEQTPNAGDKVKRNRNLYLVVSTDKAPLITLPDVRDISYRNAKSMLESMGFQIQEVEYVPSEYKDLVKDIKMGDRILAPGTKLAKETSLKLVVGTGDLGDIDVMIPSLRGLTKEAAIQQAHADSLSIRTVNFDVTPKSPQDEAKYIVYKQNPVSGTSVKTGSEIDLWLSKDKSLLDIPEEQVEDPHTKPKDIEEFF